jgi:hypothetical protein
MLAEQVDHVIGVDTHRDSHTAAVLNTAAALQAQTTLATDAFGYKRLLAFARKHAPGRRCRAIEGTGSYGAGLATFLLEHGEWVIEIDRPKRPARRNGAKSDDLDAARAAREALSREHLAQPRQRGWREAMRVLLITRESAMVSRTKALVHLKSLLVCAPSSLRDQLRRHRTDELVTRCSRLRTSPTQTTEHRATSHRPPRTRARGRGSRPRKPARAAADRDRTRPTTPARNRTDQRRTATHRLLTHRTTTLRGRIRVTRRRRPDTRILRTNSPLPPQPRRRSPAQPSTTHSHPLPPQPPPADTRLRTTPHHRRKNTQRDQALPKALPRTSALPTTTNQPTAHTNHRK